MRFMYIDWQSIISKEIVSWLICLFLEWCFIKLNPVMFLVHDITRKWDLPNMHKACGASECEHARSMGYLSIEDSLYSPDARWCNLLSVLFVVLLAAIDILFGWTHCGRWCWHEFRFHRRVCMVCFYYYVCCVVCVGIVGCCCVFCCELRVASCETPNARSVTACVAFFLLFAGHNGRSLTAYRWPNNKYFTT